VVAPVVGLGLVTAAIAYATGIAAARLLGSRPSPRALWA
jgi:hypothetical protein